MKYLPIWEVYNAIAQRINIIKRIKKGGFPPFFIR